MRVVDVQLLENRMTKITVARRFLIFFWKYTVYVSGDVIIPYERWEWVNLNKRKKVMEPRIYWELDAWTNGDMI